MDPPSMVKGFKYRSAQQPMFNVVELQTPLHYRDPSFQDASFSSYHKSRVGPPQKSQENHVEDTEISIFDAQKYFSCENNDTMKKKEESQSIPRLSTDGYGRNFSTRSFNATPTASSEASCNSQTGLLVNPPGSVRVSLRKDDGGKKRASASASAARKWILGRKCCCTGNKAVEVKEVSEHAKRDSKQSQSQNDDVREIHQHKTSSPPPPPPRQQRISASLVGGFSFPILNANGCNQIITKGKPVTTMNPLEDPPRDSLEVFQPMHEVARPINTDDDVGSDASSDLFEIESFSTQTTSYPMYRRRDSLDEAPAFNLRRSAAANGINCGRRSLDEPPTPSVAATECYAPSEVSIDWSVTTAEGFDRASVSNFSISASEMGSAAFLRRRLQEETAGGGDSGKKKGNGGGLLMMSCRQEKAVSVGPQPVKCMAAEGVGVLVGGRPPRANKPPLASDHSARLSLAFAA